MGTGDEKRAKIIAEQQAREEADRAASPPKAPRPRPKPRPKRPMTGPNDRRNSFGRPKPDAPD